MRKQCTVATLALMLSLCLGVEADPAGEPATKPMSTFDRVRALSGSWEFEMPGGKTVKAFYQPISNGTCVMATVALPGDTTMTTIFHRDGGRLVLDHYSWLNNVPRMKGTLSADGKELDFALVSCTNLASPAAAHMQGLKITFDDEDHFTEQWTMRSKGKDRAMVFHFQHED